MLDQSKEHLSSFLSTVTQHMGVPCSVSLQGGQDGPLAITLAAAEDGRFLIGKGGQNLNALEHVARAVWARLESGSTALSLDINDYRQSRTLAILALVREAAQRVRNTRRSESLDPMSSYERRIVHTELASYSDLATESVGQDPNRRVVIKLL